MRPETLTQTLTNPNALLRETLTNPNAVGFLPHTPTFPELRRSGLTRSSLSAGARAVVVAAISRLFFALGRAQR
jgi:hypothetical protein